MSSQTLPAGDEPDIEQAIGRRVHQLMWDRRVTGVDLAAVLGIDQSGLSKRLRGERGWSAANLVAAAKRLDATVAYLVGEVSEWAPWGSNPRPADYEGVGSARNRITFSLGRLAPVTPIEHAFEIRRIHDELVPA